jgi:hypothetical protein
MSLDDSLRALAAGHEVLWEDIEPLMTDGYARVLVLEAERLRVMRELVELAGDPGTADRAAALTTELDGIATELTSLRTDLLAVRRRFTHDTEILPNAAAG